MFVKLNKYDYFLAILIISIAFGNVGGALQFPRACTILLFPSFLFLFSSKEMQEVHYLVLFLGTMIGYSFLSLLWCTNVQNGLEKCFYNLIHYSFFLELISFSIKANNPIKVVVNSWLIAFLGCALIGVWELASGHHLSYNKWDRDLIYNAGEGVVLVRRYASVAFGNHNMFVAYACFSLPFIFYSMSLKNRFSYLALILFLPIILYNASRGGLLTFCVMSILFFLAQKSLKVKITSLCFLLLIIGVYLWAFEGISDVALDRMSEGGVTNDDSRLGVWGAVIASLFGSYGIGSGVGNLFDFLKDYTSQRLLAPHNLLLEFLGEYGVFCFLYLVLVVVYSWRFVDFSDLRKKRLFLMVLLSFPFYSIINSLYLTGPAIYVFFASVFIVLTKRDLEYENT